MVASNLILIMIDGFFNKNKGCAQLLYEKGLWKPNMITSKSLREMDKLRLKGKAVPSEELFGDKILSHRPDF